VRRYLEGLSSLIFFPLFATGVTVTGFKFAAGFVDIGVKLPPVSLTPAANLPPVQYSKKNLYPVSTSRRIFEKLKTVLGGYFGLGGN
jgi:hypothetical protein